MARPSKYSPGHVEAITLALGLGNTRTASAQAGGISLDTFHVWLERYPEFHGAVEKAEAEAERAMVAQVRSAANDGTWTAAAWWLERRRHRDWGKIERQEHTGKDGGDIVIREVVVSGPGASPE